MNKFVVILMALALVGVTNANMLTNGDFQSTGGWAAFGGTAITDQDNGGVALPSAGRSSAGGYGDMAGKMWSPYWGAWNPSGLYQQVAASPGQSYTLSGDQMQLANDAIGAGGFGLIKLTFHDAGGAELAGYELTHLASGGPTNVWTNVSLTQVAPAGTVKVGAYLMMIGPTGTEAGAAYFDNINLTPEPATLALLGLGGLVLRRRK